MDNLTIYEILTLAHLFSWSAIRQNPCVHQRRVGFFLLSRWVESSWWIPFVFIYSAALPGPGAVKGGAGNYCLHLSGILGSVFNELSCPSETTFHTLIVRGAWNIGAVQRLHISSSIFCDSWLSVVAVLVEILVCLALAIYLIYWKGRVRYR